MIRNISLIIFLVLMFGCKKEAALQAENADDNTLTVKDNPSDPVDHAIYQFYQSTGIPCFYNDTISRKEVGTVNGVPRYFYKRLTVNWSPALGVDTFTQFRIPLNKADLLPMLSLIKNELLPLIPDNIPIHSILFADTVFMYPTIWVPDRPAKTEMNAFSGFNTLVLRIINPDTLTAESKKHYLNDVLKEICVRQLGNSPAISMPNVFYSISRRAYQNDIYITDFTFMYPDGDKKPEDFGLLFYFDIYGYIITCSEQDDLRIFLETILNNSSATLNSRYASFPVVIEKINVLRALVKSINIKLPD